MPCSIAVRFHIFGLAVSSFRVKIEAARFLVITLVFEMTVKQSVIEEVCRSNVVVLFICTYRYTLIFLW
jgi:hypothetical protein